MSTIGEVYSFLLFICDHAGKSLTPVEAQQALEAGQLSLYNEFRTRGFQDNNIQAALGPFVTELAFSVAANGRVNRPSDYVQGLRLIANGKEHLPILFNEVRDAEVSQLEPISDYPRYHEHVTYLQLYPQKSGTGTLTYYRLPAGPVINFTLDSQGNPTYASGGSTQLEVPKAFYMEVIKRALTYIGISLSDADVVAYSQQMKG